MSFEPPNPVILPLTGCACDAPGNCPRHGCAKSAHWHRLCRTRLDYFALWEQGRGPGQKISDSQQTHGLGDLVASLLHRAGIHGIIRRIQRRLGIRDCGCRRRRNLLNRLWPARRRKTPD